MRKFDILVVGAGTGGSIAAKTASKMGFKVCVIDQKPNQEIGDKVCGDAIGKHHFDNLGISPPMNEELANLVKGIDILSPDMKTVFRAAGEGLHGFMVNRLELGQRLLSETIDSGVELLDNTCVLKPIVENGFVKGVKAKNVVRDESVELSGNVVIDASGMVGVIRKQVPLEWRFEREILNEDLEICYQEIREVSSIEHNEYLQIYLDQEVAPGGYCWIFPKGENMVNVGLGVQMKKGFLNPREQFYKHLLSKPLLNNSKKIKGGGGIVSTRRPINCMVGNGVLFIGDAACQPNPIHGGGIGPSMLAGHLAAKAACEAIEKNDVSQNGMWKYNSEYMAQYGAKTAGLDVFRIFLQKCSNIDLNYGMSNRLIMEDDILKASLGEDLKLNITDKARRAFRGIRRLSFLRALNLTAHKMREIKELYIHFPNPEGHAQWSTGVESIINEMKGMNI
ncbi:MAG: NAD(P)/FAD-dependent oxidoreductase [Candidatus Bathyarchaeota archaeon]